MSQFYPSEALKVVCCCISPSRIIKGWKTSAQATSTGSVAVTHLETLEYIIRSAKANNKNIDATYTHNIEKFVHRICTIAHEKGEVHQRSSVKASSSQLRRQTLKNFWTTEGLPIFKKGSDLKLLAQAFKEVGDPLIMIVKGGSDPGSLVGEDGVVVRITELETDKEKVLQDLLGLNQQDHKSLKQQHEELESERNAHAKEEDAYVGLLMKIQ